MKQLKQAIYSLENSKNSLHNDSLYKSGLVEQRKELALIRSQLSDKKKELVYEVSHSRHTCTFPYCIMQLRPARLRC
jgi:hypothetical protein